MPATVDEAIAWFEKCVGTTESPPGSNKTRFGEHFGMNGVAWCAEFIWDGLAHHLDVDHIKSAYTPTVADWYKQRGRGFSQDANARRGDLVFFDFPDSTHRIQHIGIVTSNDPGKATLQTIEGNTSSGSSGSQDNGGGVFRRSRAYSLAVYYGRPAYAAGKGGAEEAHTPADPKPNGKLRFESGDKGADIKTWQQELNAWATVVHEKKGVDPGAWFPLHEDGEFGPNTVTATKFFQGRQGLEQHGRVGIKTISAMERVREKQWLESRKKKKG